MCPPLSQSRWLRDEVLPLGGQRQVTSDQWALHCHGESSGDSVSAQTWRGQAPSRHPLAIPAPRVQPTALRELPGPALLSSPLLPYCGHCQQLPVAPWPSPAISLAPHQLLNVLTRPTPATPTDSGLYRLPEQQHWLLGSQGLVGVARTLRSVLRLQDGGRDRAQTVAACGNGPWGTTVPWLLTTPT